ncbi:hypothetical protein GLOIN_2v1690538 [Rhizophagus clarus]|uniref:Uncharacterized protein n=1 Tax=Rhizophagus clarus TaxID=94130 RepID=A0A8H3R4Q6_9GLOM|nr:hypothetical protein GLOIN_2v1690538 [Rhizophagus clarus]
MSDDAKYYYVNKLDLELAVDEAYFKKYILKRLPDHDWSSLKEKQDKNGGVVKAYSLEMFGFIEALSRHILRRTYKIIQASQGDRERSDDSDTSDTELMPPLTISSSSTAADKSKSVVTPEAPEEEMDISFTEEDQPAPQLHINKIDKPNTDSSTKKDKKKRKKKKSRQDQSHEADQVTKPIPSSSSSNPLVLEESPPIQSSTPEKGKTLGKTDKQMDIYSEDEANYIVTGFLPSPLSTAVRDILIYDIPAKWSNIDILQHLSSWSRIISIQVKRQKKYKTVRCKFEMNELFLEYDTNKSYLSTWDNMKDCIDKPMIWNGAQLKWSCHLGPSNNKTAYNKTNKIKPSKRSTTNNSQNLSPKSNTVGTGLNRIPIGTCKGSKQAKKTEDDPMSRLASITQCPGFIGDMVELGYVGASNAFKSLLIIPISTSDMNGNLLISEWKN